MNSNTQEFKYEKGSLGEILSDALKKKKLPVETLGEMLRPHIKKVLGIEELRMSENENPEMIVHVQVIFDYSNGNKIEAIKFIRQVLDIGLLEAKNFVEAAGDYIDGVSARMTATKFGELIATLQVSPVRKTTLNPDRLLGLTVKATKIESEKDQPKFSFVD